MRRFWVGSLVLLVLFSFTQVFGYQATGNKKLFTDEQAVAAARLPEVHTLSLDATGIPTFVTGRLGTLASNDLEGAKQYLQDVRALFRGTGQEEFRPVKMNYDGVGLVHMRFQQYFRDLPVVGAEMIVHADELTGEVTAVNGKFMPWDDALPTWSTMSPIKAMNLALREAGVDPEDALPAKRGKFARPPVQSSLDYLDEPELTYVVGDSGKVYLAWVARVSYEKDGRPYIDRIFADAITGDLVLRLGLIKEALNRKVYNANHTENLPGTLMFSEGGSSSDVDAQSAYNHAGSTYNYYKNKFNRDSYTNSGTTMISCVHLSTNYVNAYWDGSEVALGDGDGVDASSLARDLDVIAHEWTHAVTENEGNMNYSNEPGALNEGMSDIFAVSCSAYVDGAVSADTWKVGEDCWTPGTSGDALRYMNNPTADGQSYDYYPERYTGTSDYGGVHLNSGIANLAYYLLCQGGTHPRSKTTTVVTGIGMAKAEQIFYKALANYMTTTTNFQGARDATAQACTDLYGATGTEYTQVQNCWTAVGVPGGPVTVTTLTNNVAVTGLGASTGTMLAYKIAVPASQTSLVVTTSGGTGDADLYVRRGAMPTTSTYDGRGYTNGNAETVTISNPVAGDFYIGVQAYSTFASVTLKAVYTGSATPNFTLALSPTTLSVVQGSSGTATVTTAVSGGFNSAVALTISGVPSGATSSFNPTSIAAPGSGTSTLTIGGGTAAAGTYTVTVTGTGGGLTKTATLSLTITAAASPNFTLSLSPTSLSVAQGATGTSTVTTAVSGGFNSAVALSVSGVPTGASSSFSTSSIAAPGSGTSTLTINGGTATAGTYTVTVTGTGGGLTKTGTLSLTITSSGGGVITLSNGVAVSGLGASTGTMLAYKIAVPSGQASLVVTTSGGTGDADLYVKRGAMPTTSSYDGRGYTSGNAETVTITSPTAGDFYIGVQAYSTFASVTLKATYTASSGSAEVEPNGTTATANTATSGTAYTAYISSSTDVDYFKISVAAGKTVTIFVDVPTGKDYDAALYNTSGTKLASGTNGSGVDENFTYKNSTTSTQTYYIKVYGYSSAYSTTLSYSVKATW